MRSIERHDGEASMAETARDAATDDTSWSLHDQAWAAHFTASRHARLAARWAQTAANLSGEEAELARAIGNRHRAAAETHADSGAAFAVQAVRGGTSHPDPAVPTVEQVAEPPRTARK